MSRMDSTSTCSPMAKMPPAAICSVPSEGSRLAAPASSDGPKTSLTFSGTKKMGSHPSATSAVMATFFSPSAATQIGIRGRTGWLISLRGLPSPVPSSGGQGDVVRRTVVGERGLAGPHVAADLDDLAGAGERSVVGHAVEALDHLGARGAETEVAAPTRNGVDAGRRHGDQRRCPAVDGHDGRADLHPLGLGRQVPHVAGCVEAVGLGHPDDVQPDLLQLHRLAGRLGEPAGVAQRHGQLHAALPFLGPGSMPPDKRVYSTVGRTFP